MHTRKQCVSGRSRSHHKTTKELRFIVFLSVLMASPWALRAEGKHRVETIKLNNGFEVAFVKSKKSPLVTVQSWYRAGSKHTDEKNRGAAYAVAALQNSGSKHLRPGSRNQIIENLGGKQRFTVAEDATVFSTTLANSYLELIMKLEAERLEHLFVDKRRLQLELEALPAYGVHHTNNGVRMATEAFVQNVFAGTEYKNSVRVTKPDLNKLKAQDVIGFYRRRYLPEHGLLIVVGNFEKSTVENMVKKYFGDKKSGTTSKKQKGGFAKNKIFNDSKTNDLGHVIALEGIRMPNRGFKANLGLHVLAEVLGVGNGSLLYQKSLDPNFKKKLLFAKVLQREHASLFLMGADVMDESSLEAYMKLKKELYSELSEKELPKTVLERAKQRLRSQHRFATESSEGKATALGEFWIRYHEAIHPNEYFETLKSIDVGVIKNLAKDALPI